MPMDIETLVQRLSTLYAQVNNNNTVTLSPLRLAAPTRIFDEQTTTLKQAVISIIDCLLTLTNHSQITLTLTTTDADPVAYLEPLLNIDITIRSPVDSNTAFAFVAKTLKSNAPIFACYQHIQGLNSDLKVGDPTRTDGHIHLALGFSVSAPKNTSAEINDEDDDWLNDDDIQTPPQLSGAPNLAGKCILMVEDNVVNQQLNIALLEETGAKLVIAENGLEALDKLTNYPEINSAGSSEKKPAFDIILMDNKMPLMDGLEATAIIRENPLWQNIPIIGLTANTLHAEIDACLDAGMNAHVSKPIDAKTLFKTISEWLLPAQPKSPPLPQVVVDFSSIKFLAPTQDQLNTLLLEFTASFVHYNKLENITPDKTLALCKKLNQQDICLAVPPLQHEVNRILEENDCTEPTLLIHLVKQLVAACERELDKRSQAPAPPTHGITIEGFECDTAIARLANKPDRYLQVLALFLKNNKETTTQLQQAITAHDWETAQRIAHSSKGLAATLGATELTQVATDLEQIIKNNKNAPTELLAKYVETFENTLTSIKKHLNLQ